MSALPPITVSTLDSDRLYALLDKLPADAFPDADALEAELGRATVLEQADMPDDVVSMHSTARFLMTPGDKEFELTLCFPHEIDGAAGKVSVTAPVGSALLGLSVGQSIDWPAPGGKEVKVKILSVSK
ncbi:nucleoside diphosphate kinase regulator [Iodobacter arcticus]|uniref:Nucleoside diphosphate kinase regulator n=1 Tax=Iodobacter arcticus TaxID=590593 RepID=A0ABW2QZG5_9NEIS